LGKGEVCKGWGFAKKKKLLGEGGEWGAQVTIVPLRFRPKKELGVQIVKVSSKYQEGLGCEKSGLGSCTAISFSSPGGILKYLEKKEEKPLREKGGEGRRESKKAGWGWG